MKPLHNLFDQLSRNTFYINENVISLSPSLGITVRWLGKEDCLWIRLQVVAAAAAVHQIEYQSGDHDAAAGLYNN